MSEDSFDREMNRFTNGQRVGNGPGIVQRFKDKVRPSNIKHGIKQSASTFVENRKQDYRISKQRRAEENAMYQAAYKSAYQKARVRSIQRKAAADANRKAQGGGGILSGIADGLNNASNAIGNSYVTRNAFDFGNSSLFDLGGSPFQSPPRRKKSSKMKGKKSKKRSVTINF